MSSRALSALRIGNFKAFGETQTIPIKPITLIFGPNSAGKSSVIHSLAYAHETDLKQDDFLGTTLDVHRTDIGGTAIDLGGFRQFVHQRQLNRRMEWGAELNASAFDEELKERMCSVRRIAVSVLIGIARDNKGRPIAGADPQVESIELSADGDELLRMSSRVRDSSNSLRIDRIASSHEIFQRIVDRVLEESPKRSDPQPWTIPEGDGDDCEDLEPNGSASGQAIPESPETFENLFSDEVIAELLPKLPVQTHGLFGFSININEVLSPDHADHADYNEYAIAVGRRAVWFEISLMFDAICAALQDSLGGFQYLGPLRTLPPRSFTSGDHKNVDWRAGGGYAWDVVSRDQSVRDDVNKWLGSEKLETKYRLTAKEYISLGDLHGHLVGAFFTPPVRSMARREVLEQDLEDVEDELGPKTAAEREQMRRVIGLIKEWRERLRFSKTSQDRESIIQSALLAIRVAEQEFGGESQEDRQLAHVDQELQSAEDAAFARATDLLQSIQESTTGKETKLVLHDIARRTDVSHRDVGIGISQVLPVLVAALGSSNALIAMEQPEIHLHPALQAELADVFVESALGKRANTFILETHSEHLMLRLLRRIRETSSGELSDDQTPVRPEDVAVIYIQPEGTSSRAVVLPITPDGDFSIRWPNGFFTDREEEIF